MKSEKTVFQRDPAPLSVAVLVLDDCNTLSFAAAVDPMRAANRRAGRALFRWTFHTATGAPAGLTSGLTIAGPALARLERCDLLIVLAGFRLEEQATPQVLAGLRRLAGTGASLAGVDGGPWLMAQAGLLDGRAATTHWEDLESFATRFAGVDTRRDRFVVSGRMATSGGAAPCIDMMLHLIRLRHGADLAARVAGALLYDPQPEGAQFTVPAPRPVRRNPLIARALEAMEAALDDPLPIPEIAARAGVSVRVLELRFRAHMGLSPRACYLRLRLEQARRLAMDSSLPVQDIALATGFGSQAGFARAFRRAYGQSVRALRQSLSG